MKKIFIFFIILITHDFKSQENIYYDLQSNGTSQAKFYKINPDSTLTQTIYDYSYGKEKIETAKDSFRKEQWAEFFRNYKPVKSIKTDNYEKFASEIVHKQIYVKRDGRDESYMFYGNALIDLTGNFLRDMPMLYPQTEDVNENNYAENYSIKEINGLTFFIYNQRVILLQTDSLLSRVFPNSEISFSDEKINVPGMAFLLKVTGNEKFGVSDKGGKVILPTVFDQIMICADAILAKKAKLWYFYDFFGRQIMKKGYRKILPLTFVNMQEGNSENGIKYQDGLLKYSVLDGKDLKIIEKIYKGNHKSPFRGEYRTYDICGTRTGPYTSSSFYVHLNDKQMKIEEKTAYIGYRSYAIRNVEGMSEAFSIKKEQVFDLDDSKGIKYEFLSKEDSLASYSPKRTVLLLKMKKEDKEFFCPVDIAKEQEYFSLYKWYDETESLDKIETLHLNYPARLLAFGGEYQIYSLKPADLGVNNNFRTDTYYKIYKDGKVGFFSPLSSFLNNLQVRYKSLGNWENRFFRFEGENGKKGWLSEDMQEFYD